MNSLTLLELACGKWLNAQSQAEFSLNETDGLLSGVNSAMGRVWRELPASYRRQTFSCAFGAAVTGTVTATEGSRVATFSFTGNPQASEGREYCTLIGGAVRNEYRAGALLHPFQDSTGTHAVTIYHDATIKLGYLVERFLAPVTELKTGSIWYPVPATESARLYSCSGNFYDLQRVSFVDATGARSTRSLFRVARGPGTSRVFESVVAIAPVPLTIVDAATALEMPFDDEVADMIASAAGVELQRHPRFRGGNMDAAFVMDRVRQLSPRTDSEPLSLGTPVGW